MFNLTQHVARTRQVRSGPRALPAEPVALLLAGGDGTRLQELTRKIAGSPIPKQYCRLLHGQSLLEATLARTKRLVPPDRTFAVINESHVRVAAEQLRAVPQGNVIVQPCNRDTGPGIVFALQEIARRFPDAVVAAFPTDHYVDDDAALIAHVRQAVSIVEKYPRRVAILGVVPDRPETGYGYLVPSGLLDFPGLSGPVFQVAHFREKPTPAEARQLVAAGALWNTFLMVFRVSSMLALLRSMSLPECEPVLGLWDDPGMVREVYAKIEPWNFSQRILTRIAERVLVLETSDLEWSDWGTPESIERSYFRMQEVPPWRRSEEAARRPAEGILQTA